MTVVTACDKVLDTFCSRQSQANFASIILTRSTRSVMLYAITGANGFIACNLIKTLVANGHSVRGTVRDAAKDGAHFRDYGMDRAPRLGI